MWSIWTPIFCESNVLLCLISGSNHITKHFIFVISSWQPLFSSYSAYALKVVSFNGEKQAITTYNKFIRKAYESARREGAVSGLGVGSVMGILFCSYGLAVWYGAKLIVDRGYNGGIVINVIMAVMSGAL